MRYLASLLLMFICSSLWAIGINEVRYQFHAIDNQKKLSKFIEAVKDISEENMVPYKEAANMKRAKYTFSPIKKLKYFNEGKDRLEEFIRQHPKNIEARYVRVLIQSEVPSFLSYQNELQEDVKFINKYLTSSKLPDDYKMLMRKKVDEIIQKNKL